MIGVVVVFVGTIFLVWGAGGKLGGGGGRNPVVLKINGDEVTYEQFQRAFRYVAQRQRGRNVEPEQIKQQTIDAITREYLLQQQVNKLDIDISDKEVNEKIQKSEQELQQYSLLRERGYANTYRRQKKNEIALQRVDSIIRDLALVTDTEIQQEYLRKNEKVKIKYIQFPKSEFQSKVKIDDEEAEEYFKENKEEYKVDAQVNIKFVKIDPKEMVSDKDIEEYYTKNRDEFREPEKVKARHILLEVESEEEKKKVKERAKEILEEAKSKETDFAELAKKYSEGPSASKGGELGYFERGKMVKPFEDAAFSLQPGEISDLVETRFGYHIIKVEDKKPPETSPFEKVKSDIKQKIVEQETAQDAQNIAEELLFYAEVSSFEEAIKQKEYLDQFTEGKREKYSDLKLEVKTTGFFEEDASSIPNIGSSWTYKDLVEKVFDMRKGVVDTVEVRGYRGDINSYFVVKLLDKKTAHIPEFTEVKDDVKDDMKTEKAEDLAFETAKKLMEKLESDDTLEDLAEKYESSEENKKKEVKESKPFALSTGGYISGLGRAREVMLAAFNMELNEIAGPLRGSNGAYIIQLVEREEAEVKKLDENREELVKTRKELLQQLENQVYQNWYEGIKSQAKIVDSTNIRQ